MNTTRVNRRSLGVNFSARGEAEVLLWAPVAKEVALVIESSGKRMVLEKQDFGYWSCLSSELKPGDLYTFELNEKDDYPDPASLSQPNGVNGASKIFNLHEFSWTDRNWKNYNLREYIFYELHAGTFSSAGTFAGVEERLVYLKELGVTAIEIMPVAQFSGTRNWGYDGVFPFAVQESYGGASGLQHLVNSCHEAGLAVVLDVVYNHLGPEGNHLGKFGPYFTDKYKTPWGDAINVDDAGCDAVRKFIIENALMWFRDFHVDALRLDAVHAIKDFSPKHILRELKERVDDLMKETGKTHYLIVECDLNDTRFIKDHKEDGYGMDAQWADEFHHALRVTAGHEQTGYYEDFHGLFHLAKSFRNAYVYDGVYSHHRDKTFGTNTTGVNRNKFIVFSQNHDHIGNNMLGERSGTLVSFDMQKVLAAAVLMSPFLPLLFMGEEYGEINPFQYFVSHDDQDLVEAVREGRKKEFKDFHPHGEVPDPQASASFEKSKLNWERCSHEKHAQMLAYYKDLISWRKRLKLSTFHEKDVRINVMEEKQVLLLHRWHDELHVLCIFNFSKREQSISLPERFEWRLVLASASRMLSMDFQDQATLNLQPESFCLYSNGDV